MAENPSSLGWNNETYSSAEMDQLIERIFGPKCLFMGFSAAGNRKWVKVRQDGTMEVIHVHSDRGFQYYPIFGLSFPWIPHGNWKKICWHRTPKSAVLDLRYQLPDSFAWAIKRGRIEAAERAKIVSARLCEVCEPWFSKMLNEKNVLEELESRRASREFYSYVQVLTVYLFWQARTGKWEGLDSVAEDQLTSYFGEGFPELKQLLEKEAKLAG